MYRDTSDFRGNVWAGLGSMFIYFMVISILAFPNGPFTRPHPILWRMVFGCSVLYLMMIQIMIHQVRTETISSSLNRLAHIITCTTFRQQFCSAGLQDCPWRHSVAGPSHGELHDRRRERIWRWLLGHHMGTDLEPLWLVRFWPLLRMGHEGQFFSFFGRPV